MFGPAKHRRGSITSELPSHKSFAEKPDWRKPTTRRASAQAKSSGARSVSQGSLLEQNDQLTQLRKPWMSLRASEGPPILFNEPPLGVVCSYGRADNSGWHRASLGGSTFS